MSDERNYTGYANQALQNQLAAGADLMSAAAARAAQGYRQQAPEGLESSRAMVPAAMVTVPKHLVFRRTMGKAMSPREQRDFAEEIGAKLAQGFRVRGMEKTHNELVIHMEKDDHYTLPEFLEEINERLKGG